LSSQWIRLLAESKDVALILSLCFNAVACAAILRLWKSREALQDKITSMLIELTQEVNRRYWSRRENN